jgi:dTMP kinase
MHTGKQLRDLLRRKESKRGYLVAFEGPEGAGKTTQRKLFKKWLESEGHVVLTTKWNSSPLVKPLIKARKELRALNPHEYCLLHAAEFRHRLEEEILPALWEGKVVLADQYLFAALARDVAAGLELNWVLNAYMPLFWPDMVFYFAVSAETSGRRAASTRRPKFYEAGQDVTDIDDPAVSFRTFVGRLIREYEALALIFQFITVDAEQSIYEQHRKIRDRFKEAKRRPWADWNLDVVQEWIRARPLGQGRRSTR